MPSYFSIVRFVPSALAEEFVNVGVLTYGDGKVRGRFLENWHRAEKFADLKNLEHARAFQDWIEGSMVPEGPSDKRLRRIDEETLRKIAGDWGGSVQITPPRASLLSPDDLLEDVAPTFLVEPAPHPKHAHDKRSVRTAAKGALSAAIKARLPDEHMNVQTLQPISGQVRPRKFDLVVSNGAPRFAAECFNFNVADPERILEQVDATAFAIEDVRGKLRNFPVSAVVAKRPASGQQRAAYDTARQTFEQVKVRFVEEAQIPEWSQDVVAGLVLVST